MQSKRLVVDQNRQVVLQCKRKDSLNFTLEEFFTHKSGCILDASIVSNTGAISASISSCSNPHV